MLIRVIQGQDLNLGRKEDKYLFSYQGEIPTIGDIINLDGKCIGCVQNVQHNINHGELNSNIAEEYSATVTV